MYAKTGQTTLNTWVRIETNDLPAMPLTVVSNNNCDAALSETTPDANTPYFLSPGATGGPEHNWTVIAKPNCIWFRDQIGNSTASFIFRS